MQARLMEVPHQTGQGVLITRQPNMPQQIPPQVTSMLIDASWDSSKAASWGIVLYDHQGVIFHVRGGYGTAEDPLQAEAMALLKALEMYQEQTPTQTNKVHIFSDCQTLVQAVNKNTVEDLQYWNAAELTAACTRKMHLLKGKVELRYVTREALKGPHSLANWTRRRKQGVNGMIGATQLKECQITTEIDPEYFRIGNV